MSADAAIARLSDLKKSSSNVQKITHIFAEIEEFALEDGLEKRLLDKLWREIVLLPRQHLILRGIYLAMPRDGVLPDTIDFLLAYVVDSAQSDSPKDVIIKGILQWLTCAVHCKVIPGKDLQHGYYFLLNLLTVPGYANELFHLLYYLTVPHLVTTYTVKRVLNVKFPKKNFCHLALLSLYKRLKPHLVDDDTICAYINDLELFPMFSRKHLECFNIAVENHGLSLQTKRCRYPNWRLQAIAYKRTKLGSIIYLSEMTLTEALREAITSDIFIGGSAFDAFLMNPYGYIFLAFGDHELHELLEIYVKKELEENLATLCFKQKDEFSMFLSNINKLMNIYGQSFVAVDNFLKANLCKWNGVLYTKQIFGLIRHLIVSDYEEFFHDILTPLYLLNVKFKDKEFSKYTIRSLAECFMNNINKLQDREKIIHSKNELRPNEAALQIFEKSFRHLCIFFVNVFQKNADILHEITDEFVLLSESIEQDEYRYVLLPQSIVHRILINSDFMLVEKVSRILFMQIQHEGKNKDPSKLVPSEAVRSQLLDFVNVFFKNILRSQIFDKIDAFQQFDNEIAKFTNIRKFFRSRNSISFMPLIRIDADGEYLTDFQQNVYTDMICEYCEYFAQLINVTE